MQQDSFSVEKIAATDDASRLEIAQHLLDSIQAQVRVADDKIRVLFGGTALLTAALAFNPQRNPPQTTSGTVALLELVVVVLHALLFAGVAFAVTSAILALLPRVRLGRVERSLYFFGHIAATPHNTFIKEFATLPDAALAQQILSQVHVNAQIVTTKYIWTHRAAVAFAVAVLLLLVKQGLSLFL